MTTGAGGARLVAERSFLEGWRSRSWRITTTIMLLVGIAATVLPQLLASETASYVLAVAPDASPAVPDLVAQAAAAGGFEVEVLPVASAAAAEEAVRDGTADVGLTGSGAATTLYVAIDTGGTFPALVAQASLAGSTAASLADAGLSPEQIEEILSLPPHEQILVGRVADQDRAGVGFVVGIVLYLALILTGTAIATAVATEKSTRISEVLLAVLRPGQLLVGTVAGVGLLGLVQVAALGVPVLVGLVVGSGAAVPQSASGDVVLAFVWVALGSILYAFVFAALGSLVDKVAEVGSATVPVNVVLIGSYLIGVMVTTTDPNGTVSTIASLFPLSAPVVMPLRWSSGLVPGWQLVPSMALTAVAAVLLARVAAGIYARGITTTGRRLSLRQVLRG